jgi:hypothetical protein
MNLLENPFHLLGASTRDDRRRILELAEERALSGDPGACSKARADLTNPRNRIAAEVAWVPGTHPEKVPELLRALENGTPGPMREALCRGEVSPLGAANWVASALARTTGPLAVDEAVHRIRLLAVAVEQVVPQRVQVLLNNDRSAAGLPQIADEAAVEHALAERREYFRSAIRAALDRMATNDIVAVMTSIVAEVSESGQKHAPLLVDQLVDLYETEVRTFLEREAANVEQLVAALRMAADGDAPKEKIESVLASIQRVVRNWASVAQPIQLSTMSRGMDHEPSFAIATEIRSVAVDLNNEHGMRWAAEQLTSFVSDVFARVPRIVELIKKDIEALQRLAKPSVRG